MALYPIFVRERDTFGLFKKSSGFAGEGGMVVELKANGVNIEITPVTGTGDCLPKNQFGLLDEQSESTKETMLGKFLATNQTPVVLGPATYLASQRCSVITESCWALTDKYSLAVDGYGEAASMAPNTMLLQTDGVLGDVGGDTRVYFMKMINNLDDLLATRVTPAPTTGMFAEKAPILIYQV